MQGATSTGTTRRTWPVVVLALLASGLAGCGEPEPVEGTGSVAVVEGRDATVRSGDGRIAVRLPGDAVRGEGRLSVEPARGADGRDGWSVELSGADLTGRARIAFPEVELEEGEPPPLVTYAATPDGERRPADDVEVTKDGVVVTTDHFSSWWVEAWNNATDGARQGLDEIYAGDAAGKQPRCAEEQNVQDSGFSVTGDRGDRVRWCLGLGDDDAPVLKVVNTRGYAVAVESSPAAAPLPRGRRDLVATLADLLREPPSKKGNTVTLLPPGEELSFSIGSQAPAGFKVLPSVPGYLLTALQYAVDTLVLVLDRAGSSRSVKEVVRAVKVESCLAGLSSMVTADVTNAAEATRYLDDALGASLGCAEDALERLELGGFAAPIAQGFTWLVAGLRTAAQGMGAAADTALDPSGYQVTVTPPPPDEPVVEDLVFTPGGYGPLRAGMSGDEAVATGLVERRSEPECTGTVWMRPEHASVLLDFDDMGDAVRVLGSYEPGEVTDRGVGVGSTLEELQAAYGEELTGPDTNEYGQQVFTVAAEAGYLTFFAAGDAGPDGEVTTMLASTGEPLTVYEGEGTC